MINIILIKNQDDKGYCMKLYGTVLGEEIFKKIFKYKVKTVLIITILLIQTFTDITSNYFD